MKDWDSFAGGTDSTCIFFGKKERKMLRMTPGLFERLPE